MFCSKCGRPVTDGALFCTFCGNPLRTANDGNPEGSKSEIPAAVSVPISANIGTEMGDSAPVYGGSMPASIPAIEKSTDAADSAPMYSAFAGASSMPLNENGVTSPETQGKSVPIFDTQTAADTVLTSAETALGAEKTDSLSSVPILDIEAAPQKVEKYYTFGHIAMCLAAVAVMAIVAGVFAGLYFSVI